MSNTDSKIKEKKVLSSFSIEPSFQKELKSIFESLGLGYSAGIRFALKEFHKKHKKN